MIKEGLRALWELVEEEASVNGIRFHNSLPDFLKGKKPAASIYSRGNYELIESFKKSLGVEGLDNFNGMVMKVKEGGTRKKELTACAYLALAGKARSLSDMVTDVVIAYEKSLAAPTFYFLRANAYIAKKETKIEKEKIEAVKELYLTDTEKIKRWQNYKPKEKTRHLKEHAADLNGRLIRDIAKKLAQKFRGHGESSLRGILRAAVQKGFITKEERDREVRYRKSVGAKLSNERLRQDGRGFYALISNQEKMDEKRRKAAKSLGFVAYSRAEDNMLVRLAENSDYHHKANIGQNYLCIGHPDWGRIAKEMNRVFRANRSISSSKKRYLRVKRRLKKKEQDGERN